jgi:hypothetical protein
VSKRETLVGATHFGKSVWSSLCSSAQLQVGAGRADLSGQGEHKTISGRVLGGSKSSRNSSGRAGGGAGQAGRAPKARSA